MKAKKEKGSTPVATSTHQTNPSEFPGYPLYAPDEDIMKRGSRVDADVEEAKVSQITHKPISKSQAPVESIDEIVDDSKPVDEFSVTEEDLEALGPADLSMDMGEDEELKHRTQPVDFSASDLDIPGSELDDDREATGSEDEENNSYSLGGDDHDDLEEDRS